MAISDDKIVHKTSLLSEVDFLSGALILVDKPIGWTSFDVVNKIRFKIKHTLGVKKIKVGHAGTLDPLATGLLLICTGKLTKEIDTLQVQDKVYSGSFKLGETTATYDAELAPDDFFPTDHITLEMMQDVAKSFTGQIAQVPPIYSAIKIDGKAAYAHARVGKDIEMKARNVTIHSFSINDDHFPEISFKVSCSKGTYIRSLAHDFGKSLDSGAHLSSLRRDSIGKYDVMDAYSIDDIIAFIENV